MFRGLFLCLLRAGATVVGSAKANGHPPAGICKRVVWCSTAAEPLRESPLKPANSPRAQFPRASQINADVESRPEFGLSMTLRKKSVSVVGISPTSSAAQDEVWDHEDVRKFLKLGSVDQIKELTRKRAKRPLPCHGVGKYVRFKKSEVIGWFDEGLKAA